MLSDPYAAARALTAIRAINPSVPIILRMRYKSEAETAMRQGATVAVAEEMEASLEVVAQTIARLDVPGNVIDVLLDSYRRESTGMRTVRAPGQPLDSLPTAITKTPIATHGLDRWMGGWTDARRGEPARGYRRTGDCRSAGRTLHHLAAGRSELAAGDVLYLLGDDSDIMLARRRLTGEAGRGHNPSEGLRPSDSPTGSLAGAPTPRAARQAHSLPLVRGVREMASGQRE